MRGFVRVLGGLDGVLDHLLHYVTAAWSKITGRSNFVLARWSMRIGLVLISLGHLVGFALEPGPFNAFLLLFLTPLWIWFGVRRLRFYGEIEKEVEQGSDALNLNVMEVHQFSTDRLFFSIWLPFLMPGVLTGGLTSNGFAFYIASHYFVLHFDCMGGKSVVRRTVDALKRAASSVAEKARDLTPQPVPIPVPIGVR